MSMDEIDEPPISNDQEDCSNAYARDESLSSCMTPSTSTPLSLFTRSASQADLIPTFVADQTPTPTRLFKNLEDAGLFISDDGLSSSNPFDLAFHHAALHDEQGSVDVSHTSTVRDRNCGTSRDAEENLSDMRDSDHVTSSIENATIAPIPSMIVDDDDDDGYDDVKFYCLRDGSGSDVRQSYSIAHAAVDYQSQQSNASSYSNAQESLVAASPNNQHEDILSPSLPAADQQYVQVLLQMSDGTLTPINLPVEALKQATPTPSTNRPSLPLSSSTNNLSASPAVSSPLAGPSVTRITNSTLTTGSQSAVLIPEPVQESISALGIAHTTRERLRAQIESGNYSVINQTMLLSSTESNQPDVIRQHSGNSAHKPQANAITSNLVSDAEAQLISNIVTAVSYKGEPVVRQPMVTSTTWLQNEDIDPKKRQNLESNRAAASRSRNKKKTWVNNLEAKTHELQRINKHLTVETSNLRDEIDMLKRALDQHKDCPPSYPNYSVQSSRRLSTDC